MRRALARLHVLERHVVDGLAGGRRMSEVAEHLRGRRADVELVLADPERPHQLVGVAERQRARGESRHRVREHVLARQAQPVERPRRDDQRVGGVEAAGHADHDLLDPGRTQPRLQAADLDVVDLLTALVARGRVRRHVREALHRAAQRFHAGPRHRARARPAASVPGGGGGRGSSRRSCWCRRGRRRAARGRGRRGSAARRRRSARSRRAGRRSRRSAPARPRPGRWSTRPARRPCTRSRRSCAPTARRTARGGNPPCRR